MQNTLKRVTEVKVQGLELQLQLQQQHLVKAQGRQEFQVKSLELAMEQQQPHQNQHHQQHVQRAGSAMVALVGVKIRSYVV